MVYNKLNTINYYYAVILLPIKPKYALAIKDLKKKVEFRKIRFKNELIKSCLVYASHPLKRIIGYFEFTTITEGHPREIWEKYSKLGGITKKDFFSYYKGSKRAYAIKIDKFVPFIEPINPFQKIDNFKVPQSFKYLSEDKLNTLLFDTEYVNS